jgi:hypothetical protein
LDRASDDAFSERLYEEMVEPDSRFVLHGEMGKDKDLHATKGLVFEAPEALPLGFETPGWRLLAPKTRIWTSLPSSLRQNERQHMNCMSSGKITSMRKPRPGKPRPRQWEAYLIWWYIG